MTTKPLGASRLTKSVRLAWERGEKIRPCRPLDLPLICNCASWAKQEVLTVTGEARQSVRARHTIIRNDKGDP